MNCPNCNERAWPWETFCQLCDYEFGETTATGMLMEAIDYCNDFGWVVSLMQVQRDKREGAELVWSCYLQSPALKYDIVGATEDYEKTPLEALRKAIINVSMRKIERMVKK